MGKEEIILQIRQTENSIEQLKKQLLDMETTYDILTECQEKSRLCIEKFEHSIAQRRKKLNTFDYLQAISRSAAGYAQLMKDELTGSDYRNAAAQADNIEKALVEKKQEVQKEILQLERRIREMENQLQTQWNAYNTWEDESCQKM